MSLIIIPDWVDNMSFDKKMAFFDISRSLFVGNLSIIKILFSSKEMRANRNRENENIGTFITNTAVVETVPGNYLKR